MKILFHGTLSICYVPMCQDSGRWAYIFKKCIVSDQDKGLDKCLAKTFPNNLATNCLHHTKENVRTRFGPKAA